MDRHGESKLHLRKSVSQRAARRGRAADGNALLDCTLGSHEDDRREAAEEGQGAVVALGQAGASLGPGASNALSAVAAAVHDVEHPARLNGYLVKARHPRLALPYLDALDGDHRRCPGSAPRRLFLRLTLGGDAHRYAEKKNDDDGDGDGGDGDGNGAGIDLFAAFRCMGEGRRGRRSSNWSSPPTSHGRVTFCAASRTKDAAAQWWRLQQQQQEQQQQ